MNVVVSPNCCFSRAPAMPPSRMSSREYGASTGAAYIISSPVPLRSYCMTPPLRVSVGIIGTLCAPSGVEHTSKAASAFVYGRMRRAAATPVPRGPSAAERRRQHLVVPHQLQLSALDGDREALNAGRQRRGPERHARNLAPFLRDDELVASGDREGGQHVVARGNRL